MDMYIHDRRTLIPTHMQFYDDFTQLFTKKCEKGDVGTPAHAYIPQILLVSVTLKIRENMY